MGRDRIGVFAACLAAALSVVPNDAACQTAAISLALDPSTRASGMGRASTAVFWGDDLNYWANPALVGCAQGVRYEYGRSQLVPDLADDVYFTRHRVTLGSYGAGLCFYGKPFGALGRKLSYGTSQARSETGEFLGEFESYEKTEGFGVGLSAVAIVENLIGLFGHSSPRISRFVDASVGLDWNDVELVLAPSVPILGSGMAQGTTQDRGYLLRVTPYNSIDDSGYLPGLDAFLLDGNLGWRLDAGYGRGEQNHKRETVVFVTEDRTDTLWTATRRGFAVQFGLGPSREAQAHWRETGRGWILDLLGSSVSFGMAWDDEQLEVSVYDPSAPGMWREPSKTTGRGWELSLGNVFSYRRGHYTDPDGAIEDRTSGWSVGLQYAGMGGVRYDQATTPQAYDAASGVQLENVTHKGFVVFVDPLAISRFTRR